MLKSALKAAALAGALLIPGIAAAVPALVTTDLNVRTGPGAQYQRIGTIPDGYRVDVDGCLRGYNWCRVYWAGPAGWVSASYLAYLEQGYRPVPLPSIGFSIGIPFVVFDDDWRGPDWRRRDWDDRRWWDRDDQDWRRSDWWRQPWSRD